MDFNKSFEDLDKSIQEVDGLVKSIKNKSQLVAVKKTVKRKDGKTHTQTFYVSPEQAKEMKKDKSHVEHPGNKKHDYPVGKKIYMVGFKNGYEVEYNANSKEHAIEEFKRMRPDHAQYASKYGEIEARLHETDVPESRIRLNTKNVKVNPPNTPDLSGRYSAVKEDSSGKSKYGIDFKPLQQIVAKMDEVHEKIANAKSGVKHSKTEQLREKYQKELDAANKEMEQLDKKYEVERQKAQKQYDEQQPSQDNSQMSDEEHKALNDLYENVKNEGWSSKQNSYTSLRTTNFELDKNSKNLKFQVYRSQSGPNEEHIQMLLEQSTRNWVKSLPNSTKKSELLDMEPKDLLSALFKVTEKSKKSRDTYQLSLEPTKYFSDLVSPESQQDNSQMSDGELANNIRSFRRKKSQEIDEKYEPELRQLKFDADSYKQIWDNIDAKKVTGEEREKAVNNYFAARNRLTSKEQEKSKELEQAVDNHPDAVELTKRNHAKRTDDDLREVIRDAKSQVRIPFKREIGSIQAQVDRNEEDIRQISNRIAKLTDDGRQDERQSLTEKVNQLNDENEILKDKIFTTNSQMKKEEAKIDKEHLAAQELSRRTEQKPDKNTNKPDKNTNKPDKNTNKRDTTDKKSKSEPTSTDDKPSDKPAETKSILGTGQPMAKDEARDAIGALRTKIGTNGVIELALKNGIQWKRNDKHPSNDYMQAAMAINKHLRNGGVITDGQ